MTLSDRYGWNGIQFAMRLHLIRTLCNLTQGELAYRSGVSRNTIVKLESGNDVKLSTIIAITNCLNMPLHAWFLSDDEWRKWYDFNIPREDSRDEARRD